MNRKTSAQDCTSKKLFELIRSLFLGHLHCGKSAPKDVYVREKRGAAEGFEKGIEAIESGRGTLRKRKVSERWLMLLAPIA
jgi:hypothetical protein